MALQLLITPDEITTATVLGGNVDIDKYKFCIDNVQTTILEPLLGTELYVVMISDFGSYTGLYLELYNDYLKPILMHQSASVYVEIASYLVDNGGVYKHTGENIETLDKSEVQDLAQKESSMAQMYIQRFEKWIGLNTIDEYKTVQDEVNAETNIQPTWGWHFE